MSAAVLYVWYMSLAWSILAAVLAAVVLAMLVGVLALAYLWRAVTVYFPKTEKMDGGR